MTICPKCFKEIIEGEDHYCYESYYDYIKRRFKEDLERNDFETCANNFRSSRNREDDDFT